MELSDDEYLAGLRAEALKRITPTRCPAPSTHVGGGGYGTGVWCVCGTHARYVDAMGIPVNWRPLRKTDACLETTRGILESRNICAWDSAKHKRRWEG